MFDINEYYEKAHSGETVDNTDLLQYIKSYRSIILWGASYLGKSLGEYLLSQGVQIDNYWDIRSEEIREINGLPVLQPYSAPPSDDLLIIYCIGNNVIRPALLKEISQKGYQHLLRGDFLFEGTVCPFGNGMQIDSSVCQGSMTCRAIFCQRLSNIIRNRSENDSLHTFSITLIINQICSLGCKCCTSYMNEYPVKERVNFPYERICSDIDGFFDAMDSVGTVTVMGGEPFMHPDLPRIIQKLLTKKNFGIVSIATSGTFPIKEENLEAYADPRVNVSFSNYIGSISEKQEAVFHKNIETIKNHNISYTVGIPMKEWSVPSTLYDRNNSVEEMINKKSNCVPPNRCMQVKNGKLHPCDFGTALYSLGLGRYEMDYVDIEHASSTEGLRQKIRDFIDQPYYRTCGHCVGIQGLTSKAAEQGYMDFKKPIEINEVN